MYIYIYIYIYNKGWQVVPGDELVLSKDKCGTRCEDGIHYLTLLFIMLFSGEVTIVQWLTCCTMTT